jgi:hypothetical protein
MKKELVPQDDAGFLKTGKVRDLCYAIDEKGDYTTVLSIGWEPKNDAIRQAWSEIEDQLKEIKIEIQKGIKSPIAYFMVKNAMDIKILSKYTGIPKRKIRKHIQHSGFIKLKKTELENYAKTFNIEYNQLVSPDLFINIF